jgi:hypothetical protein
MKKSEIIKRVSGTFNKVSFHLKKHSPEILVVVGVVGTVASAVMACKATTKISEVLEDSKETIDKIHECVADETLAEEYSKEDSKKDLTIVYIQTGVKLAKLYAPAIILGAFSITSILASNNILRKRNVALAAAYATVDKGFKEYRNRVVERFGKEVDRELKYDIKAKQFEKTVVDENGKKKKIKEKVNVTDLNTNSCYTQVFDESNPYWENNSDYNLLFLRAEQSHANNLLMARGYLFLNEVHERLGFQPTKAGQIVGWVYNPDNPDIDNYVDFGIIESNRDLGDDYSPCFLLDFNVDGNIWELMSDNKNNAFQGITDKH